MIILLSLLPTLVLSNEPLIDWTKCGNVETGCACATDKGDLRYAYRENCTKGGFQNKYFTENSALIQVQLTEDNARDFGEEPKIMIAPKKYRADQAVDEYFGCKRNKKTRKVELTGDNLIIKSYEITLFEDRSRFEKRNAICAFIIGQAHELVKDLRWRKEFIDGEIIAKFSKEKRYKMTSPGEFIYMFTKTSAIFSGDIHSVKCNPYSFKDLSYSDDYHVKPIMNRDRDVLNCKNYETHDVSYTMRYDHSEIRGMEMKELKCAQDPSGSFLYSIVRETNEIDGTTERNMTIEEQISSYNDYTFYCAADIAESCENPAPGCHSDTDPTCPIFNAGKAIGSPATLECPDNKWLIDGEYYQLEADPVCKRMKYSKANEAKFYAKIPCGYEVPLAGARCYTEYDCMTKSKLDLPLCEDDPLCGIDETDRMNLKCKDETKKLSIYSHENDKTLTESSYKCNTTSGLWYNGHVTVREGSVVGCDLDIAHGESETKFKRSSAVDEALPQLLKAIKTLLDTLTGVSGDSPNQSRLQYGTTEETRESDLAGAKQP